MFVFATCQTSEWRDFREISAENQIAIFRRRKSDESLEHFVGFVEFLPLARACDDCGENIHGKSVMWLAIFTRVCGGGNIISRIVRISQRHEVSRVHSLVRR